MMEALVITLVGFGVMLACYTLYHDLCNLVDRVLDARRRNKKGA